MVRAWMKSVGDAFGRLARCTRAGVAVIGALSLTTIVGMGAFAVELGRGYAADATNQRIADMAALAGALAYNVNNNTTQMTASAKAVVVAQGLPASAATVALVTDAPTSKQLVQVTITTTVPLALARVLTASLSYDVTATGSATTSTTSSTAPPCIAALSATPTYGITLTGGVSINAPGCAIGTNAGVTVPYGTTISAKQVLAGKSVDNPGSGITTSPTANNILQNKSGAASDWMKDDSGVKGALCQVNKLTGTSDADYADGNTNCISARVAPTTVSYTGPAKDWTLAYEDIGATEPGKYQASAYSCNYTVPAGTYSIRKLTVPGGCKISFASGSTLTFGSIDMSGDTMTIGNGSVTVAGDFKVNANNPITVGNGDHSFGSLTILGGKKIDIGSGNFNLAGGMSLSGGAYIKVAIGVGNTVVIGKDSSGNAITVEGGSQVCFTSDCTKATAAAGVFSADGNISNTGGGSLIVFPKSVNHVINGNLTLSSGAIFGAGLYIIKGNFTNGTGGTIQGTDISFALSGTFSFAGGTTLDLAAPGASASYGVPNVLLMTKSSSATKMGGGTSGKYSGLVYAPKSDMVVDGGASMTSGTSACLMLIVNTLSLNGGTAIGSSCTGMANSSSSVANVALFK